MFSVFKCREQKELGGRKAGKLYNVENRQYLMPRNINNINERESSQLTKSVFMLIKY